MKLISRFRPLTVTLMVWLAATLADPVTAQTGSDDFWTGQTVAIPADAPVVRAQNQQGREYTGSLHPSLVDLIEARERGAADLPAASDLSAVLLDGGRVLVEIRLRESDRARAFAVIDRVGGRVRHALGGGVAEAWVPIAALPALAGDDNVVRVWPAMLVQPLAGSETSQGLAAGQAGPWHAAGLDGSGATIAIIDSFNDTGGEVDDLQDSDDWPSGSQLTLEKIGSGSFGDNGDPHGNAVLEIAFDIAPGADFIAFDVVTIGDWIEAINQAVDDGADVISASLGAPLNGIGDGSAQPGSVAEAVEDAADQGVLYVNSAGNSREQHWGGLYESSGDPDQHDWSGDGQQINYHGPGNGDAFCLVDGAPLRGELFWADWGFTNDDYDLLLFEFDGTNWQQREASSAAQGGLPGQTPQEFISTAADSQQASTCGGTNAGVYGWGISRVSSTQDLNHQFFSAIELDERVLNRSLTFPADSPSAISVAALDVANSEQEPYSSQGPILAPGGDPPEGDEYPKPDVASFANVDTVSFGPGIFNGTSSAAPHVAGMLALLSQRHPAETRAELLARLHDISGVGSNDLGNAGHEFRHGYGRTRFQLEDALAVTRQPENVPVDTTLSPVEVEVRDDEGLRVISGPATEVETVIEDDPSGGVAVLSGTATRAVDDGLVSFDDLVIDTTGSGYSLGMTSSGPGPAETNRFDVTAGAATQLAFDVQPSDADAGQAITPAIVVQVLDADGNVVISDDSTQVELTIAAGPGGATVSGGGPQVVGNGEATFDNVRIDAADTGYRLEASDVGDSLSNATSELFDIFPGEPASLVFDVQPSDADAGQAIAPAIVVQVLDDQGNVVTDDNNTEVGLSIASGPGNADLSGGGPRTVSNGEASFDSVRIDIADTGYQLGASDTGGALSAASSTAFEIRPGEPAGLAFGVQPSDTPVDESIAPAIVVQVVDSEGNLVSDENGTFVELAIAAGPGGATLSGDGPVLVDNGKAVFPDASIDQVGEGYRLDAADSGGSLAAKTSEPFTILAGDPASLAFVVEPSDSAADRPVKPTVTVEVLDADGNRVARDDSTRVELLLSVGGNVTGAGPISVTDGVAEFPDLTIEQPGADYRLEAVDEAGALTSDDSQAFDIIVDVVFEDRFEDTAP